MPNDSRAVARRFIELAEGEGETLTPMQLIKLVYIAHGWMLGLYGRQLISDDIVAWKYGPVIGRVYDTVKRYGRSPITHFSYSTTHPESPFDEYEEDIIRQVYDVYGQYSGIELSSLTHQPGTPWHKTWRAYERNVVIPQDVIEEHFQSLADGPEAEST